MPGRAIGILIIAMKKVIFMLSKRICAMTMKEVLIDSGYYTEDELVNRK